MLILIENASVEKLAHTRIYTLYVYTRTCVYEHRYRCNLFPSPDVRRQRESASAPANIPGESWYGGVIQFDTPTHA